MRKVYFIFALFGLMSFMQLSCVKSKTEIEIKEEKEEKIQEAIKEVKTAVAADSSEVDDLDKICDSVYPNKNYRIDIKKFSDSDNMDNFNSVFVISQLKNNKKVEIYRDSIYIQFGGVEFKDFNNDNVKDILIQNDSDVRSNLTYNLYLVDLKKDKLKKIRGFNEIKNPRYLSKYNLIDNEVMSGRDWTSFYEIQGDTIKDFGYTLYWGEDENGNVNTQEDYKKTINKIVKRRK